MLVTSTTTAGYSVVRNPFYEDMVSDYEKLDVFLREKTLKSEGISKEYLPPLRGMDDNDYKAFVTRTSYVNYLQKSVQALTVLATIEDPQLSNIPKKIETFLKDINITKTNQKIPELSRTLANELIFKGRVGALVDAPKDGGSPFISVYSASNIIDWNYEIDPKTGHQKLTYVHIVELGYDKTKSYAPVSRHIELKLVNGKYTVKQTDDVTNKTTSTVHVPKVGNKPLNYIPFIIMNWDGSNPDTCATPPLMTVVHLSQQHYIKSNFLEVVQHTTSLPTIFVMTNIDRKEIKENLEITPFHLNVLEADDKVEIIESSGSSTRSIEETLNSIERQISLQGARLFSSDANTGSENSSVFTTKSRNEMTLIHSVQESLSDIMEYLLPIFLKLSRKVISDKNMIEVTFIEKTIEKNLDSRILDSFLNIHEAGLFPVTSFYHVLKRGGYLDFSVSLDQFKEMLKDRDEFTHKMTQGNIKTEADSLGISQEEWKKLNSPNPAPQQSPSEEKKPQSVSNPKNKPKPKIKPTGVRKNPAGNNDGIPDTPPNERRAKRRKNRRMRPRQKQ